MQVFMSILSESRRLPLSGREVRSENSPWMREMVDRGLSVFASVLNRVGVYLPIGYADYVFHGMPCDLSEIRRARIDEAVYAEAVYMAICEMHIVWAAQHQKSFGRRREYRRLFLPMPLLDNATVEAFLGLWRCILNDLEQYKGDHQVLDYWREQQKTMVRENRIVTKDDLVRKIAAGDLSFRCASSFPWPKQLRDIGIAEQLADDLVVELANIMREVNS